MSNENIDKVVQRVSRTLCTLGASLGSLDAAQDTDTHRTLVAFRNEQLRSDLVYVRRTLKLSGEKAAAVYQTIAEHTLNELDLAILRSHGIMLLKVSA